MEEVRPERHGAGGAAPVAHRVGQRLGVEARGEATEPVGLRHRGGVGDEERRLVPRLGGEVEDVGEVVHRVEVLGVDRVDQHHVRVAHLGEGLAEAGVDLGALERP